jgi:excisionase family DNA binding protein
LRNLRENLLGGTANTSEEADGPVEALSVREAAARAGVSRTLIYERIASGELPTLKIGKRRLVRVEALRLWLKSLETKAV